MPEVAVAAISTTIAQAKTKIHVIIIVKIRSKTGDTRRVSRWVRARNQIRVMRPEVFSFMSNGEEPAHHGSKRAGKKIKVNLVVKRPNDANKLKIVGGNVWGDNGRDGRKRSELLVDP